MITVRQAIVVEGRYDSNLLRQIVDAPIFETSGFGIFSDAQKLCLLRRVAEKRGLIILTDGDGAGFVIRNYLRGALPKDRVLNAYVPDIYGKERRKRAPGKEGKLGVEAMPKQVILDALRAAGAELDGEAAKAPRTPVTKQDFYELGLSGKSGSEALRKALAKRLELPERMSANALCQAVNVLFERDEFYALFEEKT